MGKASTHAKDKYNAKNYDDIRLRVPRGKKEEIQAHAEAKGESVNAMIWRLIAKELNIETE